MEPSGRLVARALFCQTALSAQKARRCQGSGLLPKHPCARQICLFTRTALQALIMINEDFSQGTSPIHSLDPRARVAVACFAAFTLALLTDVRLALAGLVPGLVLLFFSRPPLGLLCRRLVQVNVFILFLWLTVPWSVPGTELLALGPLSVTAEGVQLALLVTLKCNAIVLVFLALVATLSLPTLGCALERLHCPRRLIVLLLSAYRYLFVLAREWETLHTAARLRGFVPGTNTHTYKTYANMLGMLFVHSLDRSQRVWEAMCLRGFSGHFPCLARFAMQGRDWIFATLTSLAYLALAALNLCQTLFPGLF